VDGQRNADWSSRAIGAQMAEHAAEHLLSRVCVLIE
jgi:hypothetical protein